MRFRTKYTLSFLSLPPKGLRFPLRIDFEGKIFEISEISGDRKSAKAFVEGAVNRDTLAIETGPEPLNGSEPTRGILLPEELHFGHFLSKMVHLLSFLIDTPISYSRRLDNDVLIPEGIEDKKQLDALGTEQVYTTLSAVVSIRSFQLSTISEQILRTLASKEVGMTLYSQALLAKDCVAKYRDLWKVLESAFGAKDKELVRLLARYGPATELCFTLDELHNLLILRGRASHAKTRSGMKELRHVISETRKRLPRLKCFVEQVLVTKKSWGTQNLYTERVAPVSAYVRPNGTLVIIKPSQE